MIVKERYGVRSDGNPVIETSTYIEAAPDHPLAEELEGVEGYWVRVAVGNSLTVTSAKPVSHQKFLEAKEEHRLKVEAAQEELQRQLDIKQREREEKQAEAIAELQAKGISLEAISALLDRAKGR